MDPSVLSVCIVELFASSDYENDGYDGKIFISNTKLHTRKITESHKA